MLLTPALRRALLASMIVALSPVPTSAKAQAARGSAWTTGAAPIGTDSVVMHGPRVLRPLLRIDVAGNPWHEHACDVVLSCREPTRSSTDEQERATTNDQRGSFALVGLVVGAAAGWGFYAYQCTHGSDCYSPVGGILLATAGGIVGLLVGVLIAPGPGTP